MNKQIFILTLFIFLVTFFSEDVSHGYAYFKSYQALKSQASIAEPKYPPVLNFWMYLRARNYIDHIGYKNSTVRLTNANKEITIIDNARIGEALGFLTENTKSQQELMQIFPAGVLDVKKLIVNLKSKKVIAPYGAYNNNYLTSNQSRLIYSDDTDLTALTYNIINKMNKEELKQPDLFANNLAKAMVDHWVNMKNSGEYGNDGLYYGKRGYSKSMLLALSRLASKNQKQPNWYIQEGDLANNLDNGSLLRAWVIGLDKRISAKEAFQLGAIQSSITHSDVDITIAAGSIASLFNQVINNQFSSKKKVIEELLETIEEKNIKPTSSMAHIKLGEQLANAGVDPVLVFNKISGFRYDDFLTLITYSFLYFNSFDEALLYSIR